MDIPPEGNRPKYFTADEVKLHNRPDDIWISFLGCAFDITPLVERHVGDPGIRPLLAYAGKDVSHWFDPATRDLKRHIDPTTQVEGPYVPHGPLLDAPPPFPSASWSTSAGQPWWKDEQYFVGRVSKHTRKIRLVNMLTLTETTLAVPEECTLWEILERHLPHNAHAASYVWKYHGRPLVMECTLQQNGIPNESKQFLDLDMDEDSYLPVIFLYFADDLTEL